VLPETPTKSASNNRMSPTLTGQQDQFGDRQFVVLTSEKQARVVALPSHNCVYRQQLTDADFVIKAEIISLKGKSCIHIGVEAYSVVTDLIFNVVMFCGRMEEITCIELLQNDPGGCTV